jgi:hypothetical protein
MVISRQLSGANDLHHILRWTISPKVVLPSMTKQEKKRLSSVLRATEYLLLENIALKLCSNMVKSQTGKSYWTIFLPTKKCWPVYV